MREEWPRLGPLERLAAFRLLPAPAALELYSSLAEEDRYFLLCARERGALAPLLEGLPEGQGSALGDVSDELYVEMLARARGR